MTKENEIKVERLIHLCSEKGLGGVLLNTQHNFAWLTGGRVNGVELTTDGGVSTLFVRRDGRRFILANRIEMSRMLIEEVGGEGYEPVEFPWEQEQSNSALVVELARSLSSDELPIGSDLFFAGARVIEGAIARARYQLTSDEIDRFRALGKDAGEAIERVARGVAPGLTEHEVARRVNDELAAVGAHSVVTLVASDQRLARFRHPVPTDLRWKKTLMIVACAKRAGLIASLTRIVCAGPIPDELRRRTEATARVNAKLFAALRPGVCASELYEVAASSYREAGFTGEENLHHQGGATGYRTRDWVAHPHCAEQVQENQAFAWNPSITGTKVEETVIASADRVEVITTTQGWPSIPIEIDGREYFLPNVLAL